MKLRTNIENVAGRYGAQVDVYSFTASEEEQMAKFGEPLVDIGGAFSGTVSRLGNTNTTVTIAGDGSGATAVPIVLAGSVTGATVTNPGTGYTTAPVTFAGDGSGAAGVARFKMVSGAIVDGGLGFAVNDIVTLVSVTVGDLNVQIKVLTVDGFGAITSFEIINAGNFTAVPANPIVSWVTSGAGTDLQLNLTWGIAAITITTGGAGYNVDPVAIAFTLPSAPRRLRTDSPFKEIFDLADNADADAMAKVWADVVVARCTSAKTTLMGLGSPLVGETVITV